MPPRLPRLPRWRRRPDTVTSAPPRPDLWELEVVYNDFRAQQRLLKERVRAAKAAGRRSFVEGQLADQELALMEDLLQDLSFWRELLVTAYVKAGGQVVELQAQYAQATAPPLAAVSA